MAAPHLTPPPAGGPDAARAFDDSVAVRQAKRALRRDMLAHDRNRPDAVASLIAHLLGEVGGAQVIAGVWPLAGEPDLRWLWHRLHAEGRRILLPETPPRGSPLLFHPWHPGCAMRPGRFGTVHPAPTSVPCGVQPDLMVVPLLAFDRRGYRLGYGGGYYDRTLSGPVRARAVGYGLSFQQVDAVPRGRFDQPLNRIVTELGAVPIEG